MTRTRMRAWLLLFLFGMCIIIWVFWFPFSHTNLYRVIPENALFVSRHDRLADRWQVMLQTPVVRSGLKFAGVSTEDIEAMINTYKLDRFLHIIGGKSTVVYYVPSLGGRPAWVMATWVGGYGQLMRWFADSKFKKIKNLSGRGMWRVKSEGENFISAGFIDGVLVVCASSDPFAVKHIVHHADYVPIKGRGLWEHRLSSQEGVLDNGWIAAQLVNHTPWGAGDIRYYLEEVTESSLKVKLNIPSVFASAVGAYEDLTLTVADRGKIEEIFEIFGDSPSGFIFCPASLLFTLVETVYHKQDNYIKSLLETELKKDSILYCGLMTGEYQSRAMGLAVPGLIVAAESSDDQSRLLSGIDGIVDEINAAYGIALLPDETTINDRPAVIIDNIRPGFYSNLGSDEKPVLMQVDNHLIIASGSYTLARLFPSNVQIDAEETSASAYSFVKETLEEGRNIHICGRIDLARSIDGLRRALAVLYMGLKSEGDKAWMKARDAMVTAQFVEAKTRELDKIDFYLGSHSDEFELTIIFIGKEPDVARGDGT